MWDYPDIRLLTLHRMLEAQTLAAFIASGVDCLVSAVRIYLSYAVFISQPVVRLRLEFTYKNSPRIPPGAA